MLFKQQLIDMYPNLRLDDLFDIFQSKDQSYKYFWFEAILKLLLERTEEHIFSFEEIMDEVLWNGWNLVAEENLHLGGTRQGKYVNTIERTILQIVDDSDSCSDLTREEFNRIIKNNPRIIREYYKTLSLKVPYRLLSPFLKDYGQANDVFGNKAFAIDLINSLASKGDIPYRIIIENQRDRHIDVVPEWARFFRENSSVLLEWVNEEKDEYLSVLNSETEDQKAKKAVKLDEFKEDKTVRKTKEDQVETNDEVMIHLSESEMKMEKDRFERTKMELARRYEVELACRNNNFSELISNVDYEDAEQYRRIYLNSNVGHIRIEKLKSLIEKPYFFRMDLKYSKYEKYEKLYIGERGIEMGDYRITDWRNPKAIHYRDKLLEIQFTENYVSQNASVVLKRQYDIENGELKEIIPEYLEGMDDSESQLGSGALDKYMLKNLNLKRNSHELTHIIDTISAEQHRLLGLSVNDQIVVQGCAGSGKTAILLHRLSVLLKNASISQNYTYVISPNQRFIKAAEELSEDLEISGIDCMPAEQFYISNYKEYLSEEEKCLTENQVSDDKLPVSVLKILYSGEYFKSVENEYEDMWEMIHSDLLEILPDDYEKKKELTSRKGIDFYRLIEGEYRANYECGPYVSKDEQELADLTESLQTKMVLWKKEIDDQNSIMQENEHQLHRMALDLKKQVDRRMETIEHDIHEIKKEKGVLKSKLESYKEKLTETKYKLAQRKDHLRRIERLDVYDLLKIISSDHDFELSVKMSMDTAAGKLEQTVSEIDTLKRELNKAERISKVQTRQRKTKEIKGKLDKLEPAVISLRLWIHNELFEKDLLSKALNQNINDLQSTVDFYGSEIRKLDKQISFWKAKLKEGEIIRKRSETKTVISLSSSFLEDGLLRKKASSREEKIKNAAKMRNELIQKTQMAQKELDCLQFVPIYKQIYALEQMTSYQAVWNEIFLPSIEHAFRQINSGLTNWSEYECCRVFHYLRFVLAALYRSDWKGRKKYLYIDEAQDLSVGEYFAINKYFRSNVVFSLFGDINQNISSYRGLQDWSDIDKIIKFKIYDLNYNYRNTVQITEYVNNKLNMNMEPIGVTGPKVVTDKSIPGILQAMNDSMLRNTQYRSSIIYEGGSSKMSYIYYHLSDMDPDIRDRIQILSVEEAKGLEFDQVLTVTDNMTRNQLYIANTRSLFDLYVI